MIRRILVTGASGFIARHALAPLANSGAEIHAVSRAAAGAMPGDGQWHQVDLLDQQERSSLVRTVRPDLILHAAWVTEHGRFWTAPDNLDWAAATLELAREAADQGLARFVGIGTCAEYGEPPDYCDERGTPLAPRSLYAAAKDATRRALEAFAAQAGISFAWARLFLLYGPGEARTRLVPDLARSLLAGRPARIGSGRAIRDFIDARDAGAGLAALAMSAVEGPVNVASGEGVSVREVALTLGRLAGRPELIEVGARPDRDEPLRLVADIRRLREEVGFCQIRPLEQGLKEALDHWRRADGDTGTE